MKTLKHIMLACLIASGCVFEQVEPTVEVQETSPDVNTTSQRGNSQAGEACEGSLDCAEGLRCMLAFGEQFCVVPCETDAECSVETVCNPIEGSSVGWCDAPLIGEPDMEDDVLPDDGSDDDITPAPAPEPDPNEESAPDPEEADPTDGPEEEASAIAGSRCSCDADCAGTTSNEGACVRGVCMTLNARGCSGSGSPEGCPAGSRCWDGTGMAVCYPDCDAVSCDGECDSDGSCVASSGMDCYASCGSLCNWSGSPPGADGGDANVPMGECGTVIESEQWRLLNADRTSRGLPGLECDPRVVEVARAHSRDMAERGYFSHTNLQGQGVSDRVRAAGITGWTRVGENIAYGQETPEAVQRTWMNSSGHRRNILSSRYTHVGVGVYDTGRRIYWTQVFITF